MYFIRGAGVAFFLILVAALPLQQAGALRILGLSFIFAGACTICGWVLGLLFGIPRTLSRPSTPPAGAVAGDGTGVATPAAKAANRVNTNLEDVSDWLTKTLVGVGLTQLYTVPHYLWQSADKINRAGFKWDEHGQLLALALFLYFAPGGFWLGYIGTRTILTKLFDSLEGPSTEDVEKALAPDALKIDVQGKISPSATTQTQSADAALLAFPMTALNTSRELAAWGAAKARSNDLESATVALQQAVKADPYNPVVKQALAKVYTAQSRKAEAQQALEGDQTSEVALFNALYEDPPGGFTKAIAIGTKLKEQPDADKNLKLHVWLACAYGQQHAYFQRKDDSAGVTEARNKVLDEVKAAIAVDPNEAKQLLRAFRDSVDDDNDLTSLKSDDELAKLLA